jgi:hypothetical protein
LLTLNLFSRIAFRTKLTNKLLNGSVFPGSREFEGALKGGFVALHPDAPLFRVGLPQPHSRLAMVEKFNASRL